MMLNIKYQGSRFCCSRQEDCFMFPNISLCKKHVTAGVGPFLAPGA